MSELAKYIDHTFLKPDGDENAIVKLCREAKEFGFTSVCVNPCEVSTCVRLLKGSSVKVCTVIDFPLGQSTFQTKCSQAIESVDLGAEELDFVLNQRLLKYNPDACRSELNGLIALCKDTEQALKRKNPIAKLIIECCNLTKDEIVLACKMAKEAGFDFVKTSTGFGKSGATVEDVKLMRKTVGKKMGVKAAGGIRDKETALAMIKAGATRIGTSAGVEICQ